jgi:hypothetical protein
MSRDLCYEGCGRGVAADDPSVEEGIQMHSEILKPVVVLILWSLVMLLWMVAVRMPALKKAGIDLGKVTGSRPGGLDGLLDARAQWPAHNYIHLMEQPTLFYAAALALAVAGSGGGSNLKLAWAYVAIRIVHSLVQALYNRIIVRFGLFTLSTIALAGLAINAARAVF